MTKTKQGATIVLIVEDDDLQREVLASVLRDAGYTVVEAGTGEAALEALRSNQAGIDWLYTDIRLPGAVDGWRVADEFRFGHPARPVIYASGYPMDGKRCVSWSRFLPKPFRATQLLEIIHDLRSEPFDEPIMFRLETGASDS
jgi:two-component system, OmpR family, response regulator